MRLPKLASWQIKPLFFSAIFFICAVLVVSTFQVSHHIKKKAVERAGSKIPFDFHPLTHDNIGGVALSGRIQSIDSSSQTVTMMWYAVGCGPDYVLEDVWQRILHNKERDWCGILGRDVDVYLDMNPDPILQYKIANNRIWSVNDTLLHGPAPRIITSHAFLPMTNTAKLSSSYKYPHEEWYVDVLFNAMDTRTNEAVPIFDIAVISTVPGIQIAWQKAEEVQRELSNGKLDNMKFGFFGLKRSEEVIMLISALRAGNWILAFAVVLSTMIVVSRRGAESKEYLGMTLASLVTIPELRDRSPDLPMGVFEDVGEFYVCVLMVLACFVIQGIFISYDSTKRWNVATAPVGDVALQTFPNIV